MKKLYYQELSMKVDEFENKRQFRCVYVSPKLKEEELVLYINKNSDVSALLTECKKKVRWCYFFKKHSHFQQQYVKD